jgi:integrase
LFKRWSERKPSTVGSYRSTIAHATETFGGRRVRRIGPEDIARFNAILRERGCSPSTRAKHLRVLGACLQAAVYYRYAESNPVRELPPAQKPRAERKEAAYFENEELPRLFARLQDEPYSTLCLVALKTGMRQGELLALRWSDVDLEQAVVRVRRSYTGGTLGTPKNRERRDVDLISDVVKLLARMRNEQRGPSGGERLVFHTVEDLGFLSPTVLLRRQLYPAMTAAGIPRLGPTQEKRTFHSFRHTFAKRALESGAQITWLSRHLGHSSLKVTTDIYGHWERAERKRSKPPRWRAPSRFEGAYSTRTLTRLDQARSGTPNSLPCRRFPDGPSRIRTCDLGIKSPLLYQLSYRPSLGQCRRASRLFWAGRPHRLAA